MMAKHIWSVFCTKTSIDRESNNISIFDVIEKISVGGIPQGENGVLAIQAELAILWIRSELNKPEKGVGRFRLFTPDETDLGGPHFEINLPEPFIRARNIIRMNSFPLRGPGIYNIIIEHQIGENEMWNLDSTIPLEVQYVDVPT